MIRNIYPGLHYEHVNGSSQLLMGETNGRFFAFFQEKSKSLLSQSRKGVGEIFISGRKAIASFNPQPTARKWHWPPSSLCLVTHRKIRGQSFQAMVGQSTKERFAFATFNSADWSPNAES
ncbi:MAG: hypothetical protein RJB11_2010 [Planctomycetota bacterium]|jgi:hypothetical protein